MLVLDEDTLVPYLIERGVVAEEDAQVPVEKLAGGFINQVFRLRTADGDLVVKQALEHSDRTILQADIERARVEVAVMRAIHACLGADAPTPAVLHEDAENFVCVMTAAPRDAVLYHDELMSGRVHPAAARAIGSYAARLHESSRGQARLAEAFASNPGFKLRDQTIRSAIPANPDLRTRVEAILDRNIDRPETLVDFDITPKNVLVHGRGITKLDFECAQYGDPAFDVGIVLAHHILFAIARPGSRDEMLEEGKAFYEGYVAERRAAPPPEFFERAAEYGAVMMLGRVSGDLIFDFCADHVVETTTVVKRILDAPPGDVEKLIALVHDALATAEAGAPAPH